MSSAQDSMSNPPPLVFGRPGRLDIPYAGLLGKTPIMSERIRDPSSFGLMDGHPEVGPQFREFPISIREGFTSPHRFYYIVRLFASVQATIATTMPAAASTA